jgi:polar amino acid transport system substrate-binding protein
VEKPLAMTINELNDVKHAYQNSTGKLMVGYNRRFSSLATKIKDEIKSSLEPKVVNIRVNAGFLEKEHWIQNPNVGGGRIIGEICHFVDLAQFFTGSKPVNVSAVSINSENAELTPNDNINITITFQNGSIANIMYLANGDKSLPKELIEVFCGGKVGRILDFRSGYLHSGNKIQKLKLSGKGHKEEVTNFIEVLNSKESELISFESLYLTTLTTFKIHDALTTGMPQTINL